MTKKQKGALIIEGHVQGLSNVRSLGRIGVPVYVLDVVDCIARYSRYCTKFFKCPSFKSEEFVSFLVELAKKEKLDGWLLVPSNDHIVENLSKHKSLLMNYYKMLVPDESDLSRIIDKGELMDLAASIGVPTPATCYNDSFEKARLFRFPVLIKGRHGLSFYKSLHTKVILSSSYEDLEQVMNQFDESIKGDVMIQELIPDNSRGTISFTCFAVEGTIKTFWMGEKLREHPIKYGTATMSQSVYEKAVLESAVPLVASLHYTGTCEIEFMYDLRDQKYKLIEINPRTWLWVGLASACGVDYAKMMYNYVNGIRCEYPDNYQIGLKWRNAITDFYYGIICIAKKKISMADYFCSLKGKIVHAVWDSNDILPGLIFPFMIPIISIRRR